MGNTCNTLLIGRGTDLMPAWKHIRFIQLLENEAPPKPPQNMEMAAHQITTLHCVVPMVQSAEPVFQRRMGREVNAHHWSPFDGQPQCLT